MNLFSISQLEQFSGIKAHTIRIWERRYQALSPGRTEGNTRYYDNAQLRRLLNIVSLMDNGRKVSELCLMQDVTLFELVEGKLKQAAASEAADVAYFISQLIAAGMDYDEAHFEKIFSNCLLRYGIYETYTRVIYPMLNRIGLLWASNGIPPAQEHFISNMLRQKIYAALDALAPPKRIISTWLLFLPEDEFHEIGLLMANYLIRRSNGKVIYLGSSLPFQALKDAVAATDATHLLFFWVHNTSTDAAQQYLLDMNLNFSHLRICISGYEKLIGQLDLAENVQWLRSMEDLEKQLL